MGDIIYKYMPFREEFFENRWLRFTPRLYLNDPFEVRPSFSQHARYAHNENGYGESVESVIKEMERNQYLLLKGIAIQDFDIYGILSLTERNDNLLMWSHYADSHRGIVIGFDSSHDFFDATKSNKQHVREAVTDCIGVLRKVRYSKKRKVKTDNLNEYFYLKSDDWWTERELRYVLPIADADKIMRTDGNEVMAFYQVPSDAIVSVIFGLKSDDKSIRNLENGLKEKEEYQHIKCYRAKMCNESYDLIIEPLRYKQGFC
ncbi:MAG: DUF2971 domain-containing protein [Neptuniibacter sp.]